MQRGILAGLDRANCNGGLHGSTLRLITFDDAYLPARTSSNMRQLIEKDHILVDALEGWVNSISA
jgi:branched-chain amino acid transport system substrate-binding protein